MKPGSLLETLVLVARSPGTGAARPRLAKELGEAEAERMQAAFLVDAVTLAAQWTQRVEDGGQRQVALYISDAVDDPLVLEMAALCHGRVRVPSGHDVGEQLHRALQDELDRGAHRVLAVFPHAPSLPVHLVEEGFRAALFHDAVVGPSFDGGAWAVGLRRDPEGDSAREAALLTALLDKQPWDTHGLLQGIMDKTHKAGFHTHWLPFWMDAAAMPQSDV